MSVETTSGPSGYSGLAYGQEELAQVMRATYDELIAFVTTDAFKDLMAELGSLDAHSRPVFVEQVLLDSTELERRGIHPAPGVLIQRSAFGDRRPTLFVVKKFLPEAFMDVWQNVNLTFDNSYLDSEISRDPQVAWRPPLQPAEQAQAMASGLDLEEV